MPLIIIDPAALTDMADTLATTAAEFQELGYQLASLDTAYVPADVVSELNDVTNELRSLVWRLAEEFGSDANDLFTRAELADEGASLYGSSSEIYGASCCCRCEGAALVGPTFAEPIGPDEVGSIDFLTGAEVTGSAPGDDGLGELQTTSSYGSDALPFDLGASSVARDQEVAGIQAATEALRRLQAGQFTATVDPGSGLGNYGFLLDPGFTPSPAGGAGMTIAGSDSTDYYRAVMEPGSVVQPFLGTPIPDSGTGSPLPWASGAVGSASGLETGTDLAVIRASGTYDPFKISLI